MTLREKFLKAGEDGVEYRAAPFWSWNDDLEPDELRRQVRLHQAAGLGGYFMHARVGRITPYLGPRWMECVAATVDEGKKAGIRSWLYDEDRWPSGSVGRVIPDMGPEWQQKRLMLLEAAADEYEPQPNAIATFVATRVGKQLSEIERLPDHQVSPDERRTVFHFFWQPVGYADVLKPEVVAQFMELTHEAYKRVCGSDFGGAIPGIFTDEPNYADPPWTERLPEIFQQKNGYDLTDHLLLLFYEVGNVHKVRYDFWRTVTDLYVETFSKRIYDWCEQNHLALTGHQLFEDTLLYQVRRVGSVMQHYEYMQIPGIDHLGRNIRDPLLNKQVSSVAHQFGGRRVLSETYGVSGWNLSFEDQKWIGDWQYVMGIDLLCPHLELYSMKGRRKRDYPPSLFHQQPWWPLNHQVSDYFGRLGAALTSGAHRADILLLHPIGSAWAVHDPADDKPALEWNEPFSRLSTFLLQCHRDYDYGDEDIIERHGEVVGEGAETRFRVGTCQYPVVILPPMLTIRTRVLDMVLDFARRGGKLICADPLPIEEHGQETQRLAECLLERGQRIGNDFAEVRQILLDALSPEVIILHRDVGVEKITHLFGHHGDDADTVYYQLRDDGESRILFLANIDNKRPVDALVRLRGSGRLEQWDPRTGEMRPLSTTLAEGYTCAEIELAPAGSALLVLDTTQPAVEGERPRSEVVRRISFGHAWEIEPTEPNALTLDYCDFRLGDGEWIEDVPTIWVHRQLEGRQAPADLELRYTFEVAAVPKQAWLLIERPEVCEVQVNGKPVPSADSGWWCDIAFRKIPIPEHLQTGENTITVRTRFEPGFEVESAYIIGDFGVARDGHLWPGGPPKFVLGSPVRGADTGDLTARQFPFYRGSVIYRQSVSLAALERGERAALEFPGLEAIVTRVLVNGKEAGILPWRPWRLDVTDLLQAGENAFEIEVFSSCRNLLGPHHHRDGELFAVGPRAFYGGEAWTADPRADDDIWRHTYSLVPFGITETPHLIIEREAT